MDFFDFLTMLSGLAMFLYGMNVMGSSLEKLSGSRFERVLEKLTNNPIKGVLVGLFVTAVIQSSSSTTVMVVGLVNSGILKLSQAVGIIMGSNIGTTVTAWLMSLVSLDGDSLFLQLCKPSSFSPVLAIIGIILIMVSKKQSRKDIGTILIGFAILMIGMMTMSDAVSGLKDVPEFASILTMFKNPVLGVIAGAVFTAITQSSSASVGILQSLTTTGSITYGVAVPIIMGQNIGTCITALLSCIGASKNAKRTAMVHLYFNLIGTVIFLTVFYTVHAIVDLPFINDSISASMVATVHSIFNISCTIILLPFTKLLEKLATITIRDKENHENAKSDLPKLDERLLNTPSFAIEQCHNVTLKMAEISGKTFTDAVGLFDNYSEDIANSICINENLMDEYEDILGSYLVKLSSKAMSEEDSREVSKILHSIGDFERISDHAASIADAAKEMHDKGVHFSEEAQKEMAVVSAAVKEIVDLATTSYINSDPELARRVEPLEQVVDELKDNLRDRHIARLQAGQCTIELGFILTDILTNYGRASDHCSNIGVCVIQLENSRFETHEYLNNVKYSGEKEFVESFNDFKKKYALPV